MIQAIIGNIIHCYQQKIIVQTDVFVWEILVPSEHQFVIGQKYTVQTYLHWNQENGPTLFGFFDIFEKELFKIILDCSGIGPKIALNIIGMLGVASTVDAILNNNISVLSSVSGVGVKKAEQISLQLKDKISKAVAKGVLEKTGQESSCFLDVQAALKTLGYSSIEIAAAMNDIQRNGSSEPLSFQVVLKKALTLLKKK